jgi:hypothetical protein
MFFHIFHLPPADRVGIVADAASFSCFSRRLGERP